MTVVNSEIDIASYIDHSLLSPTGIAQEVEQYCQQANQFGFPTVCVYPSMVRKATELLQGKQTQVCTVIGFPTGASTSAVKLYEAKEAVENGATELDVVINLGWVKTGLSNKIYQEIAEICTETRQTVKVVLETNLLTDTEKRLAAEICMDGGASYLKTSTGWFGGATVADVSYLNQLTRGRVGIKASGGIRTLEQALALIEAGATRLGTSHGVDLVRQQREPVRNI
ncbi:MAG: deoxyribose-phosphate aldolase [cyanobacterium endosymbiont of Rhopalodia gibba]